MNNIITKLNNLNINTCTNDEKNLIKLFIGLNISDKQQDICNNEINAVDASLEVGGNIREFFESRPEFVEYFSETRIY